MWVCLCVVYILRLAIKQNAPPYHVSVRGVCVYLSVCGARHERVILYVYEPLSRLSCNIAVPVVVRRTLYSTVINGLAVSLLSHTATIPFNNKRNVPEFASIARVCSRSNVYNLDNQYVRFNESCRCLIEMTYCISTFESCIYIIMFCRNKYTDWYMRYLYTLDVFGKQNDSKFHCFDPYAYLLT